MKDTLSIWCVALLLLFAVLVHSCASNTRTRHTPEEAQSSTLDLVDAGIRTVYFYFYDPRRFDTDYSSKHVYSGVGKVLDTVVVLRELTPNIVMPFGNSLFFREGIPWIATDNTIVWSKCVDSSLHTLLSPASTEGSSHTVNLRQYILSDYQRLRDLDCFLVREIPHDPLKAFIDDERKLSVDVFSSSEVHPIEDGIPKPDQTEAASAGALLIDIVLQPAIDTTLMLYITGTIGKPTGGHGSAHQFLPIRKALHQTSSTADASSCLLELPAATYFVTVYPLLGQGRLATLGPVSVNAQDTTRALVHIELAK